MTTRSLRTTARNLILYVDKRVIVISKPPGIVSQTRAHPSQSAKDIQNDPSNNSIVLEDSLNGILDDLTRILRLESRPLPVHRLDKSTTGALLLARTPHAARDLSHQFRSRIIRKTYLALVRAGRATFDTAATTGDITVGLTITNGRVSTTIPPDLPDKPAKTSTSKDKTRGDQVHDARTGWELVASSTVAPISLLRLTLHTGFKHQLRVHLASVLKAPILGDTLYSRSPMSEKIQTVLTVPENRLFLHASSISFFRYRNMVPKRLDVEVTAPLPKDFAQLCDRLGVQPEQRDVKGGVVVNGEWAPWNMTDYEGWERRDKPGVAPKASQGEGEGNDRDHADSSDSNLVDLEVQQR